MKKESTERTAKASKADLDEVHRILLLFNHAVAAAKMYPPSHPNSVRFRREFLESLAAFFKDRDSLPLEVRETAFLYQGEVVQKDENLQKSTPYLFFKDGVRGLSFRKGLEEDEFNTFVEIIRREAALEPERSDMALALWEQDLEKIGYVVPDEFLETKILARGKRPRETKAQPPQMPARRIDLTADDLDDIYKKSLAIAAREKSEAVEYGQRVTAIDKKDKALIASFLAAERAAPPEDDFIDMLDEVMEVEDQPEALESLLGFIETFMSDLIRAGRFAQADRLLNILDGQAGAHPPHGSARGKALARIGDALREKIVPADILEMFRCGKVEDVAGLFRFLEHAGPRTLPLGAEIFESIQEGEARSKAYAFLRSLGLRHPDILVGQAAEDRTYLNRGIIRILSESGERRHLTSFLRFLRFKDAGIRMEAAMALGRIADPAANKILLQFLKDEAADVRTAAALSLHPDRDSDILPAIVEMTASRGFQDRDAEEKTALFLFLGRTGAPEALAALENFLIKSPPITIGRSKTEETSLAAVAALEAAGTAEAAAVLEKGALAAEEKIGAACRAALERLAKSGIRGGRT